MKQRQSGLNQDIVQEMNRSLLLHLLREEDVCSRARLAQLSNLKQATVTKITSDFLDWGLIKETGFLTGCKGRRSIGITINRDYFRVIGVRLARRYFQVGLYDLAGELLSDVHVDISPQDAPSETLREIISVLQSILDGVQDMKILAIGMAIPGPFIRQKGRIALMTENSSWNEISLQEQMEAAFQIPVFLEHDANAGALAQRWSMRGQVKSNAEDVLAYVAAGQGIGAGLIVNGALVKGALGTAGEIGHTTIHMDGLQCECGNRGCLEKYCSSIAFLRRIAARKPQDAPQTLEQVRAMMQAGDAVCLEEYQSCAQHLGIGLVNLIYSYNPKNLIIGDEMTTLMPERMLEVLDRTIRERVLPEIYDNMHIGLSITNSEAILCGAAIVAIQEIFKQPLQFL